MNRAQAVPGARKRLLAAGTASGWLLAAACVGGSAARETAAASTAAVPAVSASTDTVAGSTVPMAAGVSTAAAPIAPIAPDAPPSKPDIGRLLGSEDAADIEALASAFPQESDPALRLAAARRLGTLKTPSSYAALSRAMSNDFDPKVRREAAVFVAGWPGGEALLRLEKYLFEEVWEAGRLAACAALSTAAVHAGDPEAARVLARVLVEDASLPMRAQALRGLAEVKDRRVIPALAQAAAREKDAGLRRDIESLMRELSRQSSRPAPAPARPRRGQEESPAPRSPGREECAQGKGWCQCSTGQLEGARRCMSKDECQGLYEDSYAELGGACRFNGRRLQ